VNRLWLACVVSVAVLLIVFVPWVFAATISMSFNGGDPTFTCDPAAHTGSAQLGTYEIPFHSAMGSANGNQTYHFENFHTGMSASFQKFVGIDQPPRWVLYYKACESCPTEIIPLSVD